MSNSKYRPAAAKAEARAPAAEGAEQRAREEHEPRTEGADEEWLEAMRDPEGYMKKIADVLQNHACHGRPTNTSMTAAEARTMLEDGAYFLHAVVSATSAIMRTVPLMALRQICGGDIPSVGGAHFPSEPEPENPKKRPRGATHPLMRLISLAVQAERLLERTCRALFPNEFKAIPAASYGAGYAEPYANEYGR